MTKKYLSRFLLVVSIISSLAFISCKNNDSARFRLELINTSVDTWGYMIISNEKPIIYQEFIPCIEGKIPFSTKADAKKVGLLVLGKLQNNQMPSCTISELKEQNILPD